MRRPSIPEEAGIKRRLTVVDTTEKMRLGPSETGPAETADR